MLSVNLDLNYFTNPKVERLTDILGEGSEVHHIRLMVYVAKHGRNDGGLDDWSPDELESATRWKGEKGLLIEALLRTKLIHPWKKGYKIHDWNEHAAHLISYDKMKEINRKKANARWEKHRKLLKEKDVNFMPEVMPAALQTAQIGNANTMQCNTRNTHTQPPVRVESISDFESVFSPSYQTVLSVYREVTGRKGSDGNTKAGARTLSQAMDAGDMTADQLRDVIRNGMEDAKLPNQSLRGIANNWERYLPKPDSKPRQYIPYVPPPAMSDEDAEKAIEYVIAIKESLSK